MKGDFLLRSVLRATEYFDKYLFEANPAILREIATQMDDFLPEQFDQLAGLEIGGIPIATAISLATGRENLEQEGLTFTPLFTKSELEEFSLEWLA